jgi:hypothetical protein
MSKGAVIYYGEVNEDGPFSALNRVCSLNGSGDEQATGEGPVIQVADVDTITCKVFDIGTDRDATTGTEVTPAPTLTSANVFDTLRTSGWEQDDYGYNFRHDVAASYLADPGEWRLIEYKITLTGGEVSWIEWRVKTKAKQTS